MYQYQSEKYYIKKTRQLVYFILSCFFIIFSRLYYLQIYHVDHYTKLSTNNFTRINKINSIRGNITDSNNVLLATNRPVKNLYWSGTGNYRLKENQLAIIKKLEEITNKKLDLNKIKINERHGKEVLLLTDISFKELSRIEELFASYLNVTIYTTFKRFYPQDKLACHILGYLGTMDLNKIGKMGLERIFESSLKGQNGTRQTTINSLGKKISHTEKIKAEGGQTIKTTLDLKIQKICEDSFGKEYSGTMIIMDPRSGAILSLLSQPNFNPSIFLEPIPNDVWNSLQEKKPFINRALNACYPPASIFKLITVAAALEKELIDDETHFNCNGYIIFGRRRYRCNRRYGHGVLSVKQALAQSCNVLFYKLGQTITIDTLAEYAKHFGLGRKTNCIFPEQKGLVPTTSWKMRNKGERWWIGDTLSASIGQSYLLVTPMQIARMISGVFEGHLVQPRFLENEPVTITPLNIKTSTLEFLRDSMKKVVTTGTGSRVSKIQDITVFAKTGTAQTCSLDRRYASTKNLEHAWFVGSFNYKEEPPLTIVILMERVGATRIAIGAARKFLNGYRKLMLKKEKSLAD